MLLAVVYLKNTIYFKRKRSIENLILFILTGQFSNFTLLANLSLSASGSSLFVATKLTLIRSNLKAKNRGKHFLVFESSVFFLIDALLVNLMF